MASVRSGSTPEQERCYWPSLRRRRHAGAAVELPVCGGDGGGTAFVSSSQHLFDELCSCG